MDALRPHNFFQSTGCAFNGILHAIKNERNIKIEIVFGVLVIILGFLLKISYTEWLICLVLIFAVPSAEIVNSAVEAVCNTVRDDFDLAYEETKVARDLAAGAVLLLAIGSAVIGLVIFLPKIFALIF